MSPEFPDPPDADDASAEPPVPLNRKRLTAPVPQLPLRQAKPAPTNGNAPAQDAAAQRPEPPAPEVSVFSVLFRLS